jgi:uncharacterized protein YndB with AHSA1/START domain
MNTQPFIIERTFNAPAINVWQALTDNEQMKQWYFNLEDFKPEVGFEFQFMAGEKNKEYLHLCKVTDVVVGKKLTYSWRYDGYPGNSFVTFELFEEGNKTRLKLMHEGIESLGPGNPDFAKENFEKGWTSILDQSLKGFLEK